MAVRIDQVYTHIARTLPSEQSAGCMWKPPDCRESYSWNHVCRQLSRASARELLYICTVKMHMEISLKNRLPVDSNASNV